MFIELPGTINQLSSVRSETLWIHFALLTELSWIGNNEVYKYLVPNGTKSWLNFAHIRRQNRNT